MHLVIRQYEGATALGDFLAANEGEVRDLISGVPGFISYTAMRDGDDVTTVTMCETEEGTNESSSRAMEFIKENNIEGTPPPTVREGETLLAF